jgi:hypothetical protein
MSSWVLVLAVAGLGCNALSVASVVARLATLQKPNVARKVVATLILPITGTSPGLDLVIHALNAQTLPPRRLIISVESKHDPAYVRALRAKRTAGFPVQVVVAGEARDQAQKCRNQQAALAWIDARDEAIVLMDGDILPQPWWLSALVSPLANRHCNLVTGHRWNRVAVHRLGTHLVTAIDRAVTLMPRLDWNWTTVVWGGSVAISSPSAKLMNLENSLNRTLSDDLSLADHASAAGLKVLTRGAMLVPSPIGLDIVSAWHFGVRQYRIAHIYRPWLWRLALVVVNLRLAAWIVVSVQLAATGRYGWILAILGGLAVLKQYLVSEIGRRVDLIDPLPVRLVQLLLGVFQPLVDLFHSSMIVAAAWTHQVRWGHVIYEVSGPNSIVVKERLPFCDT